MSSQNVSQRRELTSQRAEDPTQGVINASGGMFEDHDGSEDIELTQDDLRQHGDDGPHYPGDNAYNGQDYGGEDGQDTENNQNGQIVDSKFGVDEEEELKKKIVLYYHTLVSS